MDNVFSVTASEIGQSGGASWHATRLARRAPRLEIADGPDADPHRRHDCGRDRRRSDDCCGVLSLAGADGGKWVWDALQAAAVLAAIPGVSCFVRNGSPGAADNATGGGGAVLAAQSAP